jgi:hypothetical protein
VSRAIDDGVGGQPTIDLHRKLGILDRIVQIARPSELEGAASRAQGGARRGRARVILLMVH